MELDMRKMRILQAIIDDYILTATPVGSRVISLNPEIALSSATIRNVMSELEGMGYLEQPHTSAGRIPSEKAYRFYVNRIMHRAMLTEAEKQFIRTCYSTTLDKVDEVIKQTAWAISSMTRYTSMVLAPQLSAVKLKRIQLVPVAEEKALAVIVTDAGIARDAMIRIPRDMDSLHLEQVSHTLTERLKNHRLDEINALLIPEMYEELKEHRDFLNQMLESVKRSIDKGPAAVELSGTTNILNYPEYSDMEKARNFLAAVESKDVLYKLLTEATDLEFSVRIGGENETGNMKGCSVVTATYRVGEQPLGSLGVIGPIRMNYARVLAILGHMGKSLSEVLTTMYEEERK